ncbi:S1 family peptidase [Streptomyces armeniacus]|uniref:S1 family peptidase n=1 Tax=Streptomyces armeniacus TaxID=83291 RepID=A0A345XPM5_9ACTN|nr:carbohydrate-binding protein [Streptomyces armeniacus]AXK33591.1 S1 family peptidase [Streptomyces armeniacus]
MLHRRVMGVCSAVVTVGALALAGLPGAAATAAESPRPPAFAGSPDVSPGMLKAMQRDLGLTPAEAESRLANERQAGADAGSLRLELGDDFAGAWVRGATAKLTVATTDRSDVRAITAKGAKAEVVEHSYAELEDAKDALDRAAKRKAPAGTPVWYVDVRTNSVVLLSSEPAAAERFAESAGAEVRVSVRKSSVKPRTFYDLRGGDAYYIGSGSRCSIGFSVTQSGQSGFVTAGHCGQTGATTTGSNRQPQGTFRGSSFPGNDYAYVATNSNWTSTPTVNSSPQSVAGSTQAMVGASICRSGSTTGWHCGSVQQLNTSVTYPQGTVNGVTRTNVCAEPGDSGGSFISGDQAQGMTSGGSGNCRSGGTTYFQPVNEALQVYGVTLTTTGGGGDPGPGDPDGTWKTTTVYQAGDEVTYNGAKYRCLQAHQAQPGWEPPNVPALWQRV